MWVFLPEGVFSITEHPGHADQLQVRARVRADLMALRVRIREVNGVGFAPRIRVSFDTDYPFRFYVAKEKFAPLFAKLVSAIDYSNFKNACPRDRQSIYLRVWSLLISAFDKHRPRRTT